MRVDGTLKSWNDGAGYGFIAPLGGGQDVFAHISAFPSDGRRPVPGEALSFETALSPDGKKRAHSIRRPARRTQTDAGAPARPQKAKRSMLIPALVLLLITAGAFIRHQSAEQEQPLVQQADPVVQEQPPVQQAEPVVQKQPPVQQAEPVVQKQPLVQQAEPVVQEHTGITPRSDPAPNPLCDGRTHCSQMRSCNEAKFFLANCPSTKMDGDRDGIPCEQQWCDFPDAS